jgi:hypothetical protein
LLLRPDVVSKVDANRGTVKESLFALLNTCIYNRGVREKKPDI